MPQRTLRWQDRWFPWLSLVVAALWVIAARQQARQIMESNSARIVGSLLVGGMGLPMTSAATTSTSTASAQDASSPGMSSGLMSSFSLLTSGPPATRAATAPRVKSPLANLSKSASVVETAVHIWERIMYGTAALLVAAAVISWTTGRTKAAHRAVAVVMMWAAIATLAGMRIIEHPSAGDMPPLPPGRHFLAFATLSAYAWFIVVAYTTRTKPADEPKPLP